MTLLSIRTEKLATPSLLLYAYVVFCLRGSRNNALHSLKKDKYVDVETGLANYWAFNFNFVVVAFSHLPPLTLKKIKLSPSWEIAPYFHLHCSANEL